MSLKTFNLFIGWIRGELSGFLYGADVRLVYFIIVNYLFSSEI